MGRSTVARWRLLRPALVSIGAGLLVCCAAEQAPPPPHTAAGRFPPTLQEAPAPPQTAITRPTRKPTPPPAESPAPTLGGEVFAPTGPGRSVAVPAEEAPIAPDAAAVSPSAGAPGSRPSQIELIGLDQPAATRLFGPAAERSDEPPATVWRYKKGTCELDLFFYLDLRSGNMRTLHYNLRDGAGDQTSRQDCLRSLTASRAN